MTDENPDDELEPRIYSGRPTPLFPPPDWDLERAEAKQRERERIEADRVSEVLSTVSVDRYRGQASDT